MRSPRHVVTVLLTVGGLLLAVTTFADAQSYDPLMLPSGGETDAVDLSVGDQTRNRTIPIRVFLPAVRSPAPVILFSHGLGGSREGGSYLGKHWSGRGYIVVCLQHPGSDTEIWKGKSPREILKEAQAAASAGNLVLRVKDVSAVLDQLEGWNQAEGHLLSERMNLEKVGMSGHSFGAVTTQAVSGQTDLKGNQPFLDPRIDAAVVMSPSSPRIGRPEEAFARVSVPWLLMTGTHDVSRIVETEMSSRLAVFPALPSGDKYELVLHDAEHFAFADRGLARDGGERNPNHHRVILALSTAFWDAFLREDSQARDWLNGDSPKSVLESHDRWQKK